MARQKAALLNLNDYFIAPAIDSIALTKIFQVDAQAGGAGEGMEDGMGELFAWTRSGLLLGSAQASVIKKGPRKIAKRLEKRFASRFCNRQA